MSVRAPIRGLAVGEQSLDEDASRYLVRVLRLGVGARFVGFDPDAQTEADVVILEADARNARVSISEARQASVAPERTPLVLIYSLAKGDKVDDVVRDATELGATKIVITRTERSVVKVEADKAKTKLDRWKRIVVEAARQCGRSDPPRVDGIYNWSDALDLAAQECETCFCLDPRAVQPIGDVLSENETSSQGLAFAIGPEGGLSSDEIEIAMTKGFLPVHMGRFVLRTETVAAAILGAIRILRRE